MGERPHVSALLLFAFAACAPDPVSARWPEALGDVTLSALIAGDGKSARLQLGVPLSFAGFSSDEVLYATGYDFSAEALQLAPELLPDGAAERLLPAFHRPVWVYEPGAVDWVPTDEYPKEPLAPAFDLSACFNPLGMCHTDPERFELCTACPTEPVVAAPEPPRMLPCPAYWVEDERLAADGIEACRREAPRECPNGELPFLSGCRPLFPPCPTTPWPAVAFASDAVFLSATLPTEPGGGTPARTLAEASLRLASVTSSVAQLIIGEGDYAAAAPSELAFDRDVQITGLCPERTTLRVSPVDPALYFFGRVRGALRGVTLAGRLEIQGSTVTLERVTILGDTTHGLRATGGSSVTATALRARAPELAIHARHSRLALTGAFISDANKVGLFAESSTVVLRDSIARDGERAIWGISVPDSNRRSSFDLESVLVEHALVGVYYQGDGSPSSDDVRFRDLVIRDGVSGIEPAGIIVSRSGFTLERVQIENVVTAGLRVDSLRDEPFPEIELSDLRVEATVGALNDGGFGIQYSRADGPDRALIPVTPNFRARRLILVDNPESNAVISRAGYADISDVVVSSETRADLFQLITNEPRCELRRMVAARGTLRALMMRSDHEGELYASDLRALAGHNEPFVFRGSADLLAERILVEGALNRAVLAEHTEDLDSPEPTTDFLLRDLTVIGGRGTALDLPRPRVHLERFSVQGLECGISTLRQLEPHFLPLTWTSDGLIRGGVAGICALERGDPADLGNLVGGVKLVDLPEPVRLQPE